MTEPGWIGKAIGGRYQIEQELGAGGMSTVYRATDTNLRRTVAVKLIHTHLSRDPQFVRRFESEATVVARLKHPNIVQVYDFNNDGGTYYIVFEYVAGESLQNRLLRLAAAKRVMLVDTTVDIVASIADALNYAHQQEVIHRDVKPANVMLDGNGQAILTDFGIAKIVGGTQHTASGVMLGTARYVSPEQVQGHQVTGQSDIYSLGATLFEMLAGRPPYQGDSVISVLMAHVNEPLPDLNQIRPGLAPGLSAVVNKAMAKEPAARFRTAGEMAQALRAAASGAVAPGVVATGAATAVIAGTGSTDAGAANTGAATVLENVPPPGSPYSGSPPPGGPPPGSPPPAAEASSGRFSRTSLLAIVGIAALLMLICAAAVIGYTVLSGDDGGAQATEQAAIVLTDSAGATTTAAALSPTEAVPTATMTAPAETPTPTASPTPSPTTSATESPTAGATVAPSPTATNTTAPTIAPTTAPTNAPTETPIAGDGLSSQITNIALQDGAYVVNYQTAGFTESLPGMHVHFFFDTVAPENAGVPGSGPWILYGGPRPFTQYTAADRPAGAAQMCILVANADHSVQAGSGNCYPLPG